MQYDWPGNIRELHNTLYRYLTLGKVQLGTLQVGSGAASPQGGQTGTGEAEHRQALPQEPLASALDRFEREYLLETLRRNDWSGRKRRISSASTAAPCSARSSSSIWRTKRANSPVQETPRPGIPSTRKLLGKGTDPIRPAGLGNKRKSFSPEKPLP